MKRIVGIVMMLGCFHFCHAQTFDEWFNQNATQKKYLLQQIAALQVYLGYVEKGYSIMQNGLTTISNIKKGDLDLHTAFFDSLKSVNSVVKHYTRIADIIALQVNIVKVYKAAWKNANQSVQFNKSELDYISKVFTNLLDGCTNNIDELVKVTTPGQLEMTDDERINRIDYLYSDMQDKYSFSQDFSKETQILALQRVKEQNDVQTGQLLNNIK